MNLFCVFLLILAATLSLPSRLTDTNQPLILCSLSVPIVAPLEPLLLIFLARFLPCLCPRRRSRVSSKGRSNLQASYLAAMTRFSYEPSQLRCSPLPLPSRFPSLLCPHCSSFLFLTSSLPLVKASLLFSSCLIPLPIRRIPLSHTLSFLCSRRAPRAKGRGTFPIISFPRFSKLSVVQM